MDPPRRTRCISIGIGLLAIVFLIIVWAVRPTGQYGEWLTWAGNPKTAPVRVIGSWTRGLSAPLTPAGLFSLFEPYDLVVTGLLLLALVVLSTALVLTWSGRSLKTDASGATRWLLHGRFRLRTALAVIAIVGLYLGWELDSWRVWTVRGHYRSKATSFADRETSSLTDLRQAQSRLALIESESLSPPGATRTVEARAAERAVMIENLHWEIAHLEREAEGYARLKQKYTHAIAHPRDPVDPDGPLPPRSDNWPFVLGRGEVRDLEAFAEQIKRYPALMSAHDGRAWILATSADDRLRDGKAAVIAATRACELSNWKNSGALVTLAAAYAEAGQPALAVKWQQEAIDQFTLKHSPGKSPLGSFDRGAIGWMKERLERYKAGKPYRNSRRYHWHD